MEHIRRSHDFMTDAVHCTYLCILVEGQRNEVEDLEYRLHMERWRKEHDTPDTPDQRSNNDTLESCSASLSTSSPLIQLLL